MILMLKGEPQLNASIDGALAGNRCDAIVLEAHDILRLRELLTTGRRLVVADLLDKWLTKFVPSSTASVSHE